MKNWFLAIEWWLQINSKTPPRGQNDCMPVYFEYEYERYWTVNVKWKCYKKAAKAYKFELSVKNDNYGACKTANKNISGWEILLSGFNR